MLTRQHDEKYPRHGGDITAASREYGIPEKDWLDLSTGINPVPCPVRVRDLELFRLPSRDDLESLLQVAREAYSIPANTRVVAVPGTEIAIRFLPGLISPGKVAVVGPTYPSHAEAWREAGHELREVGRLEEIPGSVAYAVVVNPNNPDGRTYPAEALVATVRRLGEKGGLLVVDESFADLAPELSLAPGLVPDFSALVFRSFGKFYGLPGLRLGFVAGLDTITGKLERLLGDWPISGTAIAIGRAVLSDSAWRDETRRRLRQDADRLRDTLRRYGLPPVGGTDLFSLVSHPRAYAIHRELAQKGIWTRVFAERPAWLRIGLPAPASFDRLEHALAGLVQRGLVEVYGTTIG
jgi:cobalamin biosynthetic protein CobC